MIKKLTLLLGLLVLLFAIGQSCSSEPCARPEQRRIDSIDLEIAESFDSSYKVILLKFSYASYFVNNFSFNLFPTAYASNNGDPCFDSFQTPINSISLISNKPFDGVAAGGELNTRFIAFSTRLNNFQYDVSASSNEGYSPEFLTTLAIEGTTRTNLDSIHDLFIQVNCDNGYVFSDSIQNVNVNTLLR
ncbi:MAG: hypothetical protein ABF242_03110 [Flavobacteriales bacterium]